MPTYLREVSLTIELSLQSSFQLSLTVLVRYHGTRRKLMTRTCWGYLAEWVCHALASARNHPSNKQTLQGEASQVSTFFNCRWWVMRLLWWKLNHSLGSSDRRCVAGT